VRRRNENALAGEHISVDSLTEIWGKEEPKGICDMSVMYEYGQTARGLSENGGMRMSCADAWRNTTSDVGRMVPAFP
jgi:hypothetical protein